MNKEELDEKYKNYAWYASQCRGSVLNEIITLERLMDNYISSYFCDTEEKRKELMALIMCTERITFDSKRQVFETIMQRRHPEVYSKNKKTLNYLSNIMQERNKLAHYMLMYSEDAANGLDNKEFTLVRFKNVVTHEVFGEPRITELINKVHKCMEIIINLHPVLSQLSDPSKITSSSGSDTPAPE